MKKITLILSFALLSLLSFGQDSSFCSKYILKNYDEMTGQTTYYNKSLIVKNVEQNSAISISIVPLSDSTIILFFQTTSASRCVDKNNKTIILFTDSTKIELVSYNAFNCKGETTINISNREYDRKTVSALSTKKIKAIRVYGTDYKYVQVNLTTEDANDFLNSFICLRGKK